jgi:hypothetical protein
MEDGVPLRDCTVGPLVCIGAGTTVDGVQGTVSLGEHATVVGRQQA